MFLAGKVEETPRLLRDVIVVSCEIRSKKDPAAMQRIKLREVYEQEKQRVLLAENVVLVNLGFDLNVRHPYKPLVAAIKKFKVAQNALAQVAWNFVNDGLRTSLCLQYEPHHIAAGAIFLAAKFLKVKLPSDGQVVWWQEFGVAPHQLEDVSNQLLELYEQSRVASVSHRNEPTGSSCVNHCEKLGSLQANSETTPSANGHSQFGSPAVAQTGCGASQPGGARQATKKNGNKDVRSSQKHFCSSLHDRNDSAQDRALSTNGRCMGKSLETAEQIYPNEEKPSDESTLSTSHVSEKNDAVDSRVGLEERQGSKFPENVLGDQTGARIQSDCKEQKLSPVSSGNVNKDQSAMEKTGKSCAEEIKSKPNMLKADLIDGDEDALIEIELESGMKSLAKAEKPKHERKETWRKYYTSKLEGSKSHNECIDGAGNGVKRKQFDENMSKKRKESSFDQATGPDRDQQRVPEEALDDQPEEGELPNSPVPESSCSPKFYNRRSQVADQLENGRRSTKWHEYEGRNQPRHRDGSHDNNKWHNYHHHPHSSKRRHRADADRYERRSRYRDWHKYNHKRRRHEY